MSDQFIGKIRMIRYTRTPENWLLCDGVSWEIMEYQALFAVIGTIYGGDGMRTFKVPDLRNYVPIGPGARPGLSNYKFGDRAGIDKIVLNATQIPKHTHMLNVSKKTAPEQTNPDAKVPPQYLMTGQGNPRQQIYNKNPNPNDMTRMSASACSSFGKNKTHENRQPFLNTSFFIAYEGTFPSRS